MTTVNKLSIDSQNFQQTNEPIGCWGRLRKSVSQLSGAGAGLYHACTLSNVYGAVAKTRSLFSRKTPQSESKGQVLPVETQRALSANWQLAKDAFNSLKSPLLRIGGEVAYYGTFYVLGSALEAPFYLLALQLGIATLPSLFKKAPPQDSQELKEWNRQLKAFKAQHPIAKPIYFSADKEFACLGFAAGKTGEIMINISNDWPLTEEERAFVLGHEFSHALNNDQLTKPIYIFAAQTLFSLLFSVTSPSDAYKIVQALKFGTLETMIRCCLDFILSNVNESNADKTALTLEPREKMREGAIRFFERFQKMHQTIRSDKKEAFLTRLWHKIIISPGGNYLLDWKHPLLSTRHQRALSTHIQHQHDE